MQLHIKRKGQTVALQTSEFLTLSDETHWFQSKANLLKWIDALQTGKK